MTGATAICKFFNEFFDYKINKNNMLTGKTPEWPALPGLSEDLLL